MLSTEEVTEVKKLLSKETSLRKAAEEEVNNLKSQQAQLKVSEVYSVYLSVFYFIFSSAFLLLLWHIDCCPILPYFQCIGIGKF